MRTPDRLLVVTIGAQWVITAGVALAATRTGSAFGEPAATAATVADASGVAHGTLPEGGGPLYPLLLAPLAALTTRPNTVSSVVTTVNILLLGPLAAYCLVEIARRIAGQLFAVVAAAAWLLGPVLVVPLFVTAYRDTYVDDVLPTLYGLAVHPAYLAMVLSLVAGLLALRAVADGRRAAFAAGLAAAAAIACLPVSAGVAVGVLLALAVAKRWRDIAAAIGGLTIGLAATLIWRYRAAETVALTLGHPSWETFQGNMANVREFFWTNRMLQWLPVAGTIGMFRLLRPAAALAGGWVAATAVVGVATPASFDQGRFFIQLIPAWPAYALLVAAIPALVPTLATRLGDRLTGESRVIPVSRTTVVSLVLILTAVAVLASVIGR